MWIRNSLKIFSLLRESKLQNIKSLHYFRQLNLEYILRTEKTFLIIPNSNNSDLTKFSFSSKSKSKSNENTPNDIKNGNSEKKSTKRRRILSNSSSSGEEAGPNSSIRKSE